MQYRTITLSNKVKLLIPSKLYRAYDNMTKRVRLYPQYQGVEICEEWRQSRLNFYIWAMCNGWQEGLELDRIGDTDSHRAPYSPSTCRWVTHKENMRNRRNSWTFLMQYWERKQSLAAPGVTFDVFRHRMNKYRHHYNLVLLNRMLSLPYHPRTHRAVAA